MGRHLHWASPLSKELNVKLPQNGYSVEVDTLPVQKSATQTPKCSCKLFIALRVTVEFCEQWQVPRDTEFSANS